MSMSEIGPLLGVGKEAEVYEFGELALKLYKPGVPKTSAFREAASPGYCGQERVASTKCARSQ